MTVPPINDRRPTPSVYFTSFKAFGDLVIAHHCLGLVRRDQFARFRLIIADHLSELNDALAPTFDVITIRAGEAAVPAVYDVRKKGIRRALWSGLHLRRELGMVDELRGAPLIFYRADLRDRLIAGSNRAVALIRGEPNIYTAYRNMFEAHGLEVNRKPLPRLGMSRGVLGVFPGSRMVAKKLDRKLVTDIVRVAAKRGIEARLYLLEGESPELEAAGLPFYIVPRKFAAMISAVAEVDAVVSADSMPAHIAEFLSVPAFVFSPINNEYWLPETGFLEKRWALFEEGQKSGNFQDFLERCTP